MRPLATLALGMSLAVTAKAQVDTVGVGTSQVVAIQAAAPVFAPVHVADSIGMHGGGAVDLATTLNQIPGVKMETRGAGGSRRIRMRGSSLRSPFGVRNVFAVLDGFVLTTADGDSPMEWFDPALLEAVEVLTGPSGAVLGGSYSGALWATSRAQHTGVVLRTSTLGREAAGSGVAGSAAVQAANGPWQASAVRAVQPGFREQEANEKWQGDLHWRGTGTAGRQRHVWLGGYAGSWGLPGALNADQAAATPTFAPGAAFDARVERRRVALGWSEVRKDRPGTGIWGLASVTDKHNPYGTSPFYSGDKHERGMHLSLRATHAGRLLERAHARWSWQGQSLVQGDILSLEEWEWDQSAARYDLDSQTQRGWASAGVKRINEQGLAVHAGLAVNALHRSTQGVVSDSLPFQERFAAVRFLPRAGVQIPLGARTLLFAEWGTGMNPPTSFEIVDPSTREALTLLPEWGQTLEAGGRWERPSFHAQATAFVQQVRDAIGVIPGPTDAPVLANADIHRLRGLEMQAAASTQGRPTRWSIQAFATLNRFEVQTLGAEFGMPGTPLHTAGSLWTAQRSAYSIHVRHRWNDRAPLNDAGTDWAPAHHRLDVTASWSRGAWRMDLSVLNATDSAYSDWYQVNAFGGKYFNPVAPRRFELALSWSPTRPQ